MTVGWGHQRKILGGAQDFPRGLIREALRGLPGLRVGGSVSKATGRQVQWPDWELTSQAGVAISCREEEGGEAGARGRELAGEVLNVERASLSFPARRWEPMSQG